jgi:hypothetical protein
MALKDILKHQIGMTQEERDSDNFFNGPHRNSGTSPNKLKLTHAADGGREMKQAASSLKIAAKSISSAGSFLMGSTGDPEMVLLGNIFNSVDNLNTLMITSMATQSEVADGVDNINVLLIDMLGVHRDMLGFLKMGEREDLSELEARLEAGKEGDDADVVRVSDNDKDSGGGLMGLLGGLIGGGGFLALLGTIGPAILAAIAGWGLGKLIEEYIFNPYIKPLVEGLTRFMINTYDKIQKFLNNPQAYIDRWTDNMGEGIDAIRDWMTPESAEDKEKRIHSDNTRAATQQKAEDAMLYYRAKRMERERQRKEGNIPKNKPEPIAKRETKQPEAPTVVPLPPAPAPAPAPAVVDSFVADADEQQLSNMRGDLTMVRPDLDIQAWDDNKVEYVHEFLSAKSGGDITSLNSTELGSLLRQGVAGHQKWKTKIQPGSNSKPNITPTSDGTQASAISTPGAGSGTTNINVVNAPQTPQAPTQTASAASAGSSPIPMPSANPYPTIRRMEEMTTSPIDIGMA